METEYQHFNQEEELLAPVTPNTAVNARSSCADIMFINFHPTATAYVNGIPLAPPPVGAILGTPGGTLSIGANRYEYNESNYRCLAPPPAADLNGLLTLGLWVIRKHYKQVTKELPPQ